MDDKTPVLILCVDDDELFLRSLVRTLEKVDRVSVDTATSAEEAREMVSKRPYAVVVTDQRMPGETGIDLLEYLAKEHANTVPVLATAFVDLEVALDAINRGRVFAFLKKPTEPSDVVMTVTRAIERYHLGQTLRDKIAELERANQMLGETRDQIQRLHQVASTDHKTGARSYSFLADRLEEEIARAQRYEQPLSLVLIDLDGFKGVNDLHGHMVGDVVLRQVAELMAGNIRKIDILARFGGDEFALLLPNTSAPGAAVVTERLITQVAGDSFEETEAGTLTLSAGVVTWPNSPVNTGEEMITLADKALYAAKRAGGNQLSQTPTST